MFVDLYEYQKQFKNQMQEAWEKAQEKFKEQNPSTLTSGDAPVSPVRNGR